MLLDGINLVEGSINENLVLKNVTESQKAALQNLDVGEIVYVTDGANAGIQIYAGSTWTPLSNAASLLNGTLNASHLPAFTGDVTTTAGTATTTLANSGVAAGTYKSVTVDIKGRVTTGTNPTTLAGYNITDAQPTLVSGTNIKTINGNNILGSGDLTISGGSGGSSTTFQNVSYSYTGTERNKWFSLNQPIQAISYNGTLSDTTAGVMDTISVPGTEMEETSFTYNGAAVSSFNCNHFGLYTTFSAPNLKTVLSGLSIGNSSGYVTSISLPELVSSYGTINASYSLTNANNNNPSTTVLNIPKLSIAGGIAISNWTDTTLTLPASLTKLGSGGISVNYAPKLTSFTSSFTDTFGSINFSGCYNLDTVNLNTVVSAGSITVSGPVLSTFTANNLVSCTGLNISSNIKMTSFSMPALKYCSSGLSIGNVWNLSTISLPELLYCAGTLSFTNSGNSSTTITSFSLPKVIGLGDLTTNTNWNLSTFSLPALTTFYSSFSTNFSLCTNLSTVSLPSLSVCNGSFAPTGHAALQLSVPNLTKVHNALTLSGSWSNVNFTSLRSVTSSISMAFAPTVTSVSFPALESVYEAGHQGSTSALSITGTGITSVNFSSNLKRIGNGGAAYGVAGGAGIVTLSGLALSQASVNDILVKLAALDGTNGTSLFANRIISLQGGTSAAPSGAGLTAKSTLQARGCTVYTN